MFWFYFNKNNLISISCVSGSEVWNFRSWELDTKKNSIFNMVIPQFSGVVFLCAYKLGDYKIRNIFKDIYIFLCAKIGTPENLAIGNYHKHLCFHYFVMKNNPWILQRISQVLFYNQYKSKNFRNYSTHTIHTSS